MDPLQLLGKGGRVRIKCAGPAQPCSNGEGCHAAASSAPRCQGLPCAVLSGWQTHPEHPCRDVFCKKGLQAAICRGVQGAGAWSRTGDRWRRRMAMQPTARATRYSASAWSPPLAGGVQSTVAQRYLGNMKRCEGSRAAVGCFVVRRAIGNACGRAGEGRRCPERRRDGARTPEPTCGGQDACPRSLGVRVPLCRRCPRCQGRPPLLPPPSAAAAERPLPSCAPPAQGRPPPAPAGAVRPGACPRPPAAPSRWAAAGQGAVGRLRHGPRPPAPPTLSATWCTPARRLPAAPGEEELWSAVIDAGSTGSRVAIFKVSHPPLRQGSAAAARRCACACAWRHSTPRMPARPPLVRPQAACNRLAGLGCCVVLSAGASCVLLPPQFVAPQGFTSVTEVDLDLFDGAK